VAALRFLYSITLKRPWVLQDDIPTARQPLSTADRRPVLVEGLPCVEELEQRAGDGPHENHADRNCKSVGSATLASRPLRGSVESLQG
jgi:hypothetical protein